MIIAVDGPAASGKGTLAKALAAQYGLRHLDTGALYRAVARDVMAASGDLDDPAAIAETARHLDPETIDSTLGVLLKYQDDIARIQGSEAANILQDVKRAAAAG